MRPRSAHNAAQCNFLLLKKFQSFKLHCRHLWPEFGWGTSQRGGGEKEGRSGREGERGLHDCIAPSPSIGGPPPSPIKPQESKLAASIV